MLEPDFSDLTFRVEAWNKADTAIEEILAACVSLLIGRGAYEAAIRLNPHRRILLRQGARVIEHHNPENAPKP